MSTRTRPDLSMFTGTNSADEMFDQLFVETGLVSGKETLPTGDRGFNLSKAMRHQARKHGSKGPEMVEDNGLKGPSAVRLPNWTHGWGNYIEQQYGHRNAFAAMAALKHGDIDETLDEFAEETMSDAETVIEKVATKTMSVDEGKQVDSGVVQGATPILVDPDFYNVVRSKAPFLDWVDVIAQAGFTASYNAVTARDQMLNWASESEVRDLSGDTGSAFTLTNEEKDMKIGYGLLDISDFAAQAQSSLDFMDLEGTSMEIWGQGYGIEETEMLLYGEPDGNLSDGTAHDANAPEGLYGLANDADAAYTEDKSTVDLTGDKALFSDIKQEVLALAKNSNVSISDIGIVTSYDVFNALEDEAEINVRLDAFDESINFGRDPAGPTTLSIAGAPILPDPNVRDHAYGSGEYDGTIGDVFIYDRTTYQRRALQPLASTDLGQLGLARRVAMYQYETPVDRAQGERIRVLEDYQVTAL